ncbi:MAG TPA: DUF4157 domain-containing protein [Thermoanaerobaculia bacterium]|nr:DUF4157 domain-containing protein [Thermoanaerobaculia bacterium]
MSFPWWLRPFLTRGVIAITLGRRIYLSGVIAEGELERLLRHELTHVRQIARLGVIRFYWLYAAEYVSLRRRGMSPAEAYRNLSFEVEALAAENTL